MKTYEEALRLFARPVGPKEDFDATAREMGEEIQRRASIGEEIAAHPATGPLINTLMDQVGKDTGFSAGSLALSAFITGVMVGMEMEREEIQIAEIPEPRSLAKRSADAGRARQSVPVWKRWLQKVVAGC